MRKAGSCELRSRPPARRSHDVSRLSAAFGRMLGQASRSTAHAPSTCNRAPSLHREGREIPSRSSGETWRGRVACPWSARSGLFALEAHGDRVIGACFAPAKSSKSTFDEVAAYRPNARSAAGVPVALRSWSELHALVHRLDVSLGQDQPLPAAPFGSSASRRQKVS